MAPARPRRARDPSSGSSASPRGRSAGSPRGSRRLAANEVTLAVLKQFRDIEHPDRACYQAIVEAKAKVRALRGFGPLPGTLRVDWDGHGSHPFAADLGLTPGGQEAVAAAWVDFDFVMEPGREVFNAARDGGSAPRTAS
ncbi:hypothetical protein [Sorangium sp. So ce861]|uniref:hypothetical protein n=1 Tax=Sorangium sp. So ce861 TaxID=3133323 RepID=UPI003F5E9CA5